MQVSTQQADRLKRVHNDLGSVLTALGILEDGADPPVDPDWFRITGKQWGLLNDLAANHNKDVSRDEWGRLGRQHGYDPRGLGGFFVGKKPLMASQGERRVLTTHGERFIERWREDFEA